MTAVFWLVLVSFALLAAFVWLASETVRDGQVAVISRFGRVNRILSPGKHWLFPLVERVERRVDTIGRSVELKDHAIDAAQDHWQVDGRVYYQILDPAQAAAELDHLEETVTDELDRVLPALLPEHRDASNDDFNQALKQSLNDRLRRRGILVARTQIQAA